VARICIEVDLAEGLPENLVIEVGKWKYTQTLDYVNIPFICSFCHVYEHLKAKYLTRRNIAQGHTISGGNGSTSKHGIVFHQREGAWSYSKYDRRANLPRLLLHWRSRQNQRKCGEKAQMRITPPLWIPQLKAFPLGLERQIVDLVFLESQRLWKLCV